MKTNCRNGQGGGDSSDNVSDAGQLGKKRKMITLFIDFNKKDNYPYLYLRFPESSSEVALTFTHFLLKIRCIPHVL